jgi:hypothetical protein
VAVVVFQSRRVFVLRLCTGCWSPNVRKSHALSSGTRSSNNASTERNVLPIAMPCNSTQHCCHLAVSVHLKTSAAFAAIVFGYVIWCDKANNNASLLQAVAHKGTAAAILQSCYMNCPAASGPTIQLCWANLIYHRSSLCC